VLTKAPDAGAYTNDIVIAALALLSGMGVDTTGEAYMPETVVLAEAGN
jgi:NitT/TauT family transport system substrate-binding protein